MASTEFPNTLNLRQDTLDIGFPRPRDHGERIALKVAKFTGLKSVAPRLYKRAETLFYDIRLLHEIVSQESASPVSNPKQESENWERILSGIMGGAPVKLVSNEEAILKRKGSDDLGDYSQVA